MHCYLLLLLSLGLVSEPQLEKPAKIQGKAPSGWPDVFPMLLNWNRTFQPPTLEKDGLSYSQTAKYVWMGGAAKNLEATLARSPNIKSMIEKLQQDHRKEEVKVGKHTAWLLDLRDKKDKNDKENWPVQRQLIVKLGEDRMLVLKARGPGPWESLTKLAERFDLERIARALEGPPRTDVRRTLEGFRRLNKGMTYEAVSERVGRADADIGSGIHIMVYALEDGSRVLLGFPDFRNLIYVKHITKTGQSTDLLK